MQALSQVLFVKFVMQFFVKTEHLPFEAEATVTTGL
jgi:hypothetical protein